MFLFLHIPKTAGTSFRFILENSFGVSHCHTGHTGTQIFTEADLQFARKFFPRLRSLAGHNLTEPTRFQIPGAFYATFLREPVARVISHYQDSVLRGGNTRSFPESLRNNERLNNLQVRMIAGEENLDKAKDLIARYDFVGLTERFDLAVHMLGRLCPYPLRLHYHKYVIRKDDKVKKELERQPEMLELARQHNALDLQLYAYAQGEVFPGLCRKGQVSPSDVIPAYATYLNALKWRYVLGRWYNKIFRAVYSWRKPAAETPVLQERTATR
jgi:hypothetical protein